MSKPRGRSGLIAVWLLLGILAVVILVLEGGNILSPPSDQSVAEAPLFAFTESDLGGIQVVYQRQIATLMRGADGLWYQHDDSHSHGGVGQATPAPAEDEQHVPDPAQSAAIAERLSRVAAMAAEPGPDDDAESGLARSETMVAFYGRGAEGVDFSEPLTILNIGDRDDAGRYYVRLTRDPTVSLVRQDDVAALLEIVFGPGKVPTPNAD